MIARIRVCRSRAGTLTFDPAGDVVFIALSARDPDIDDAGRMTLTRRSGHVLGPFGAYDLVRAARARLHGLRVWYDQVDAPRRDDAERLAGKILEAAGIGRGPAALPGTESRPPYSP